MKKKNKLTIILTITATIAVAIIISYIIINTRPKSYVPYYTDEPETWISNEKNYDPTDKTIIDIDKMTKSESSIDNTHQKYIIQGQTESFYYHAYYNGNKFKTEYVDPIFYNLSYGKPIDERLELKKQYLKMRISTEITSKDGVIEGLIVAREENKQLVFYIFLDEDWKNSIPDTNIIWGDDLNNKNKLTIRKFNFDKKEKGVYIERIDKDVDWFAFSPSKGGILVGGMSLNEVIEDKIQNKTFMYVR